MDNCVLVLSFPLLEIVPNGVAFDVVDVFILFSLEIKFSLHLSCVLLDLSGGFLSFVIGKIECIEPIPRVFVDVFESLSFLWENVFESSSHPRCCWDGDVYFGVPLIALVAFDSREWLLSAQSVAGDSDNSLAENCVSVMSSEREVGAVDCMFPAVWGVHIE